MYHVIFIIILNWINREFFTEGVSSLLIVLSIDVLIVHFSKHCPSHPWFFSDHTTWSLSFILTPCQPGPLLLLGRFLCPFWPPLNSTLSTCSRFVPLLSSSSTSYSVYELPVYLFHSGLIKDNLNRRSPVIIGCIGPDKNYHTTSTFSLTSFNTLLTHPSCTFFFFIVSRKL